MRTSPRCVGIIKPTSKRVLKNGLVRYLQVKGDTTQQRCTKSINCPHHRAANARIIELPLEEPYVQLTREQIRYFVNIGYMAETGRSYYQTK